MLYKITGNQPFQVLSNSFSISPSESGYDLYLSADGINYSPFITVASGVTKQMVDMNEGNYYRLMGNTSTVTVNWMKECGGGGGGAAAGVSSLDGQTGALTTKTINGNAILGSGDIVISGGTGSEVSYSQTLSAGTEIGQITIDGSATTIYAPADGVAQYDLDAMTQAERAEFVAMCENLTDEERRLLFVYRDGVICRFDHTEGSDDSFKIGFSDYRQDGWDYPTTLFRHFFVTADGSYQQLGNGVYPNVMTFDTTYSDTAHTLSNSDNLSPIVPISGLGPGEAKVALNLRLLVGNNQTVLSSKAWSERTGSLEGKICAEWHYSGNVITAVWNVVEHTATIASWTEVPEGGPVGEETQGVSFGNSNLYYNPSTGVFKYGDSVLDPTGTTYSYIVDYGILDGYITTGEKLGNIRFLPIYTLYISGDTESKYCNPVVSVTVLPSPVTIDGAVYMKDAAFDYGEWILRVYINGNNNNANFRMEQRKKTVALSQADYDALVLAGTVDANTLYIII